MALCLLVRAVKIKTMNKAIYFSVLRNHFPDTDNALLDELENNCRLLVIDKGETIIKYQAHTKMLFYIVSGSFLRNIVTSRGEVKTVMFHTESFNEFFKSYDTIYFHNKTDYEVKANEKSVLLAFDFDFFFDIIKKDTALLLFYTAKTESLFANLDLFHNFQLGLTSEEYLQWLHENHRFLFHRFPAQHIASFMGITPVWLSKLKAKFVS